MRARTRIKFELDDCKKIFKFNLIGISYKHIDSQIEKIIETKRQKYEDRLRYLTWDVYFLD